MAIESKEEERCPSWQGSALSPKHAHYLVFISRRGKEMEINCCLHSASERQVVETNQRVENKCKETAWTFRKGSERD